MEYEAKLLVGCDKESVFPFFFTYVGAFKWYQAYDAVKHPEKENMILISSFCAKREMNLNIQLPEDSLIEIYDGIAGECPE